MFVSEEKLDNLIQGYNNLKLSNIHMTCTHFFLYTHKVLNGNGSMKPRKCLIYTCNYNIVLNNIMIKLLEYLILFINLAEPILQLIEK